MKQRGEEWWWDKEYDKENVMHFPDRTDQPQKTIAKIVAYVDGAGWKSTRIRVYGS